MTKYWEIIIAIISGGVLGELVRHLFIRYVFEQQQQAQINAEIAKKILSGEKGPLRDIVLLNAAFAIVAGAGAYDIPGGIKKAAESIDSGAAKEKLEKLIEVTNK